MEAWLQVAGDLWWVLRWPIVVGGWIAFGAENTRRGEAEGPTFPELVLLFLIAMATAMVANGVGDRS